MSSTPASDLYKTAASSAGKETPVGGGEAKAAFPAAASQSQVGSSSTNQPSAAVFRGDNAARIIGRGPRPPDPRKYNYDTLRGLSTMVTFGVTKDDRMPAEVAGAMLDKIHQQFGVETANESVLAAFDSAMWLCHAINGASVLNPGRAKISIPGHTHDFDFAMVRDYLGEDFRRFFRAYADDVINCVRMVLRDYDPYDSVKLEKWAWVQQTAHDRGLSRFPHLIADSAEAALELSAVERQALSASKAFVISSTPNSADRMMPLTAPTSKDRYDSSVGATF